MKFPIALAVSLVAATSVHAEPLVFQSGEMRTQLLELFTSEGCSSCPPADAWMSKLTASPELWKAVVPVVFPVDYWDRLGWPDRFARREFTEREYRYAAAWRSDTVYTPCFVLGGREWRGWSANPTVPAAAPVKAGQLTMTLRDRAPAEIVFVPAAEPSGAISVEFALLAGDVVSEVKRGENGGRKLKHDFVAVHLASAPLTRKGGTWTASIPVPAKTSASPNAAAAWIVAGSGVAPLQATGGWLAPR